MKKLIYIISFLFITTIVVAQPYGNEWINFSQKYLKFQVVENGVYKITYSDLKSAMGTGIDTINPTTIQIWGRGTQQQIYVEGEADNSFDLNDYIEFYAQKNDGWFDTLLYDSPSSQVNPYYSLYNDTATYFITFSTQNTLRYTNVSAASITTPDNYFLENVIAYNPQVFWQGAYSIVGAKHDVAYTKGEGWFFTHHGATVSKTIALNTPNAFIGSGINAIVETQYAGVNNPATTGMHHVEIAYNNQTTPIHSNSFIGFDMVKPTFTIPINELTNTTNIVYSNGASTDPSALTAVAYAKIIYPKTYNSVISSSKLFKIPAKTALHQIQLTNFNNPFNKAFVYDFENGTRTIISNANVAFTLPPGIEREIFVFSSENSNFKSPINISTVETDGYFTNYLAANPTNAFVIITAKPLLAEANNYAAYRATNEGGNNNVLVALVEDLYDQFAYGINKHPLSIRHFADYLLDSLSTTPKNLFLIGKSIVYKSARNNVSYYRQNLVPTIGYPATDNFYTAGLNGTMYESAIPTGRLAALNPNNVVTYLNKIKEYEAQQNDTLTDAIIDKDWMKHFIHFGGGNGVSQQSTFQNFLKDYQIALEGPFFGGFGHEYYKNSADVIQQTEFSAIKDWVEYGVSMITFFGHSSAQGFDVSLDDPATYNNQGKYPLFTAFGCQSGNIHTYVGNGVQGSTSSENFILTPNRGAIAFVASTDAGVDTYMDAYANFYFNNITANKYNKSIGEIMKTTVQNYQSSNVSGTININKSTCLELALHGDPSLTVNSHHLPDYAIEPASVSFTPEIVSTDLTTFIMNVEIVNLGRAITDSVTINITRYVNDEPVDTIFDVMPPIYYKYIYQIELPTDAGTGSGINKFDIWIDKFDAIDEMHTTNNFLLSDNRPELYISSDDLIPIFPYNYAVVGHQDITLKASTAEIFAPTRSYKIQIDYKDTYDSQGGLPLDEIVVTQSGGVVSWTPNLGNIPDSTVFFWRCAPMPIDATTNWREHSFQYITNQTGWGQDDFFQFKNDNFWVINHKRPTAKFEFDTLKRYVSAQTVGSASNYSEYYNTYYSIDGLVQKSGICYATPAMYVAVFDSTTLSPWEEYYVSNGVPNNFDHQFGNVYDNFGCWSGQGSILHVFMFPTTSAQSVDNFTNMLTTGIPDSNYFLVYTARSGNFESTVWDSTNFAVIESFGVTGLSTDGQLNADMSNNSPFIFFTKKGKNSTTREKKGAPTETILMSNLEMISVLPQGYVESTIVGPAYNWGTVSWKQKADEIGQQDSVSFKIYGIDLNGNDSLFATYTSNFGSISNFNSIVDAAQYPFLKLRAEIFDKTLSTSGQLERWHVLYDGIPEAALNPFTHFSFVSDTLQEGQNVEFSVAIENVSPYDMDSLRVNYWVDKNNIITTIPYPKQDSLKGFSILTDTITYKTLGFKEGINTLWIDVNPEDALWQLEQYHFNNIVRKTFYVEKDITNPLLDVTFDGIHILNGDIVSPQPTIVMELKDENPYIPINDTSSFDLYITDPNGTQTLLKFNGADPVVFIEATLPKNKAKVEYTPIFKTDGTYILTVQGKDASGNKSGDFNYSISFEVISKSTITEVLNYPNPFSTSTRFVFTLTGSKIPEQFKIQILTVSGKVVREITADEIGPINIGRNISQYAWNGTDEFGDPLANGVYIYRVVSKIDGQAIENRTSGADKYFNKGFGKMYLMR